MKMRLILAGFLVCSIMLPSMVFADSKYGEIDVYYNGKLLPGTEVAKPTLKIGEPFTVKIEMTLNQPSVLFVRVDSLGDNMYEVVEGPSEFRKTKHLKSLAEGMHTFEWTLKPTDEWAGGTMPVNFGYQINLPGEDDPVVNSEFTMAYPHISTEYYEGDTTPTTTTDPESPSSIDDPTTSSTPAFTFLASALAIVLATARRS